METEYTVGPSIDGGGEVHATNGSDEVGRLFWSGEGTVEEREILDHRHATHADLWRLAQAMCPDLRWP